VISSIESTTATPVVLPVSSGRPVAVSGLLGSVAALRGARVESAFCGTDALLATVVFEGGMGRATQAPVAESARTEQSVFVAGGAGHGAERQHPAGSNDVTKNYPSKKWAFRGLEPWRDPA
jgi:hypothetical protein